MTILVTSGCSFSECKSPWINTWPKQLETIIEPTATHHEGLGAQGNGMISREIIWRVSQLLEHKEQLIVGIMWTSPDRHEVLLPARQLPKNIDFGAAVPGEDKFYNPYNWIDNSVVKWLILNKLSNTQISREFYSNVHNEWLSQLLTVEHILRVQWFLKLHNIRYFMSTYTDQVLFSQYCNHPDVKYLYDQIDFDHFLPVDGEYEWCRDHSGLEFPVKGDQHPSSEQHKLFTEQVILPFLKQKDYV